MNVKLTADMGPYGSELARAHDRTRRSRRAAARWRIRHRRPREHRGPSGNTL